MAVTTVCLTHCKASSGYFFLLAPWTATNLTKGLTMRGSPIEVFHLQAWFPLLVCHWSLLKASPFEVVTCHHNDTRWLAGGCQSLPVREIRIFRAGQTPAVLNYIISPTMWLQRKLTLPPLLNITLLILLDLAAVFDTMVNAVLLDQLRGLGVEGTVNKQACMHGNILCYVCLSQVYIGQPSGCAW